MKIDRITNWIQEKRDIDKFTFYRPGEVRSLALATITAAAGIIAIYTNFLATTPISELANVLASGSFAVSGAVFICSETSRIINPFPFPKNLK